MFKGRDTTSSSVVRGRFIKYSSFPPPLPSQGELVTTPMFDGEETFIAYPPLTNIHDDLRVEMEFKPLHGDGLMFFCGGKKMKVEDFVGISMVEGHVEFRYELGTGEVDLTEVLLLSVQIKVKYLWTGFDFQARPSSAAPSPCLWASGTEWWPSGTSGSAS